MTCMSDIGRELTVVSRSGDNGDNGDNGDSR
jgi:hypothetical protein